MIAGNIMTMTTPLTTGRPSNMYFNHRRLVLTDHAVERAIERVWPTVYDRADVEDHVRRLLPHAVYQADKPAWCKGNMSPHLADRCVYLVAGDVALVGLPDHKGNIRVTTVICPGSYSDSVRGEINDRKRRDRRRRATRRRGLGRREPQRDVDYYDEAA